ncbi:SemiSWEET family transporter [Mesomycoplasma lagogenitalium]|uniref:SemiSWEET family transporter n=1 Tax=Mesomycoplasma lagogenitalium TaxID=171286 RepID=A0ABY8LUY7_9BACT|nr:SemiSWEET family transporter [Mesomycoplasma lagogenitalium]WGI37034.1 SemiSWEET family transporter [Mesomycoplasma lagogenitalium]
MVTTQYLFGIIAVLITPFSTVPQLYKTWKTKEIKNLSFSAFWILWIGSYLWILYSLLRNETSYFSFLASFVDISLISILIFLFYKYTKNKHFIFFTLLLIISYLMVILIAILSFAKILLLNNEIFSSILINCASFCIAFASLPQVIKAIYLKKIKGLSLFYKTLVFFVEVSWFIYWLIAGLLSIYKIEDGIAVTVIEMIQLLIWASIAIIINGILVCLILFKEFIPNLKFRKMAKENDIKKN